jgi:thiamine biosynthesis lipoprotein
MGTEPARFPFRAMGSLCELRLYAEDPSAIAQSAIAEVSRLEAKYSRYRDDSLLTRINRSAGDAAGVRVDAETAGLLDYAETAWRASEGRFDLTSGVLREAWDFRSGRLPAREAVDALLPRVGWQHVVWQRPQLVLTRPGMQLDLGGIVKEYAADRVAELCRRLGARGGVVDLGGDLAIIGPHPDGSPWRVGVRDPFAPERALVRLAVFAGGVATSGDTERCMWVDGSRYGHILDPRSGWPVEGPAAVTVLASHCLIAGTASTVAMLRGRAEGPAWLAAENIPHVCVDQDGSLTVAVSASDSRARRECPVSATVAVSRA